MKKAILCFLLIISARSEAQDGGKGKNEILAILQKQEQAWNNGDLNGFMEGYWNSDSLVFIGHKGITYGWKNTLKNYRESYPDKASMGRLSFEIISVEILKDDAAFVMGKWQLLRETGNPKGFFSLVWKKMEGRWVITIDHST